MYSAHTAVHPLTYIMTHTRVILCHSRHTKSDAPTVPDGVRRAIFAPNGSDRTNASPSVRPSGCNKLAALSRLKSTRACLPRVSSIVSAMHRPFLPRRYSRHHNMTAVPPNGALVVFADGTRPHRPVDRSTFKCAAVQENSSGQIRPSFHTQDLHRVSTGSISCRGINTVFAWRICLPVGGSRLAVFRDRSLATSR